MRQLTKLQKIISFGAAVGTLLAVSPMSALAVETINLTPTGDYGTLDFKVSDLVSLIISLCFVVAGVVSFIFLLIGGVQWILAGGDKEGTEKARKRITAALIGLASVFSAYALNLLIGAIFGLSLTSFDVPVIGGVVPVGP